MERYGSDRGLIFDRNYVPLVENEREYITSVYNPLFTAQVPKRYGENQLCRHIIGYTDYKKDGVAGIEKDYNAFLKSIPNHICFSSYSDARGNPLLGKGTVVDKSAACSDSGIVLSIDAKVQRVVETCSTSLSQGAVIVLNSNSGEILAAASFPQFTPSDISAALHNQNQPLLNRVLCNYNVGSVFKIVICMAALESGISPNFSYYCSGSVNCGGIRFHCHKTKGHGSINMKQAVAFSCNTYFISLAQKVGREAILEMCRKLELTEPEQLSKSIIVPAANLPAQQDLSSPAALANFSFGQGELLLSPAKLAAIYAAVQNGGKLTHLQLLKEERMRGKVSKNLGNFYSKRVIQKENAARIQSFLKFTVEAGTGKNAYSEYAVTAGKTATAQTGKFEKGKEKLISYFIGNTAIKGDNITVLVMKENGSSGSADCVPIFKSIVNSLAKIKE